MADEEKNMNADERSVYELAFHINPSLSETEAAKTFESLKEAVVSNGGEVITDSTPRRIDLAYTISLQGENGRQDFTQGLFGWIAYEGLSENQKAIEEAVGEEKNVIRSLIITTSKDVVEYAKQREEEARSIARNEAAEGEEGVSEDELDEALESATM